MQGELESHSLLCGARVTEKTAAVGPSAQGREGGEKPGLPFLQPSVSPCASHGWKAAEPGPGRHSLQNSVPQQWRVKLDEAERWPRKSPWSSHWSARRSGAVRLCSRHSGTPGPRRPASALPDLDSPIPVGSHPFLSSQRTSRVPSTIPVASPGPESQQSSLDPECGRSSHSPSPPSGPAVPGTQCVHHLHPWTP